MDHIQPCTGHLAEGVSEPEIQYGLHAPAVYLVQTLPRGRYTVSSFSRRFHLIIEPCSCRAASQRSHLLLILTKPGRGLQSSGWPENLPPKHPRIPSCVALQQSPPSRSSVHGRRGMQLRTKPEGIFVQENGSKRTKATWRKQTFKTDSSVPSEKRKYCLHEIRTRCNKETVKKKELFYIKIGPKKWKFQKKAWEKCEEIVEKQRRKLEKQRRKLEKRWYPTTSK